MFSVAASTQQRRATVLPSGRDSIHSWHAEMGDWCGRRHRCGLGVVAFSGFDSEQVCGDGIVISETFHYAGGDSSFGFATADAAITAETEFLGADDETHDVRKAEASIVSDETDLRIVSQGERNVAGFGFTRNEREVLRD